MCILSIHGECKLVGTTASNRKPGGFQTDPPSCRWRQNNEASARGCDSGLRAGIGHAAFPRNACVNVECLETCTTHCLIPLPASTYSDSCVSSALHWPSGRRLRWIAQRNPLGGIDRKMRTGREGTMHRHISTSNNINNAPAEVFILPLESKIDECIYRGE
jgi:hypothetical protein